MFHKSSSCMLSFGQDTLFPSFAEPPLSIFFFEYVFFVIISTLHNRFHSTIYLHLNPQTFGYVYSSIQSQVLYLVFYVGLVQLYKSIQPNMEQFCQDLQVGILVLSDFEVCCSQIFFLLLKFPLRQGEAEQMEGMEIECSEIILYN